MAGPDKPGEKSPSDLDLQMEAVKQAVELLRPFDVSARKLVVELASKILDPTGGTSLSPVGSAAGGGGAVGGQEDIRSFTAKKNPRAATEMAAVMAYYLAELAPSANRKTAVTQEEVTKYFKQANFRLPSSPKMTLIHAKNAGYFDSAGTGSYKLNPVGYNLVTHSLPAGDSGPANLPKARRPRRASAGNRKRPTSPKTSSTKTKPRKR